MPSKAPVDLTKVAGRFVIEGIPDFTNGENATFRFDLKPGLISDPKNAGLYVYLYVVINAISREARVFVQIEGNDEAEEWTGDCSCSLNEQIALIKKQYQ